MGRYWKEGNQNTYQVRLSATGDNRSGYQLIAVKKPDSLGTIYNRVQDVEFNYFNLDSLIILFAGREGVLPQYIKAIIQQESNFHPCYRYEPFADIQEVQQKGSVFDTAYRYWIKSSTELGDPGIPTHTNLYGQASRILGYPGYQMVWDYYNDSIKLYGPRSYPGIYTERALLYQSYLDSLLGRGIDSVTADEVADDTAEQRFQRFLKYDIGGIGMLNTIAQTRIAASYGMMQITYYNDVRLSNDFPTFNYPYNDSAYLPESINIDSLGIEYGVYFLEYKIRVSLGKTNFPDPSWMMGLETTYLNALTKYNRKGRSYASQVTGYVPSFLPLSKK